MVVPLILYDKSHHVIGIGNNQGESLLANYTLLAALAAAPVQLDLEALKVGQLPTAGTIAEADTCAVQTTYMFIALSSSDQLSEADKKSQLVAPRKAWVLKAAELRGTNAGAYMNDKAVTAATISMAEIPSDSHFDLHRLCRERLIAGPKPQ
jgi:hypothetical protein